MKQPGFLKRRTKIVCTIGPATGSAAVIDLLIRSGMNVARLNLSHGTHDIHAKYIQTVRRSSRRLGIKVAVLMDLPGPKYRTGRLKGGQVTLQKGSRVTLTMEDVEGDAALVPVNLPTLPRDVAAGDTILLDDGAMQLRVLDKNDDRVVCRVILGGILKERRGLVVPGMRTSGPFITEALRRDILFAIQETPEYLAISFINNAEEVLGVKDILRRNNADIPVIAKIEKMQAVKNFDDILEVSDGIMVARGDLGVDIPLERVPIVQKEIIKKCNRAGKPVITATQMLESMVQAARPTRAEVSDIANAILDGTDGIMLSAETSIGKFPIAAVRTMSKTALEAEKHFSHESVYPPKRERIGRETDELISLSACNTADALGAVAIIAFTQSGSTAMRVSKYRPKVPILAVTPGNKVSGRLLLYRGVYPFEGRDVSTLDGVFAAGAGLAKELGLAKSGDLVVITGGLPVGVTGSTNLLKVEKIT